MAYLPMISGWGGAMSETTLWTNSTPTSSFAQQIVTLSQDYTQFDLIRVYYRASTSSTVEKYVEFVPDLLSGATLPSSEGNLIPTICSYANGFGGARMLRHDSNTTVQITHNYYLNSATQRNQNTIPIKICGLK